MINDPIELERIELKTKTLYLAKTAHEIKNVVLAISSLCNSVQETDTSSSDDDEKLPNKPPRNYIKGNSSNQCVNVSYINALSTFALSLIEDLNAFAKINNNQRVTRDFKNLIPCNVVEVLDFCVNIFLVRQVYEEHKRGIKISFDNNLDFYYNKINICDVKLKQIVINLLSNAYKFTQSGQIELTVKLVIDEDNNKVIRISVTDTGTGMTRDEIEKLFKPFTVINHNQVMNSNGSGLGLYIVNEILNEYGSKLEVSSQINVGSTFWFDIPTETRNATRNFSNTGNDFPYSYSFAETSGSDIMDPNKIFTESLKNLLNVLNGKEIDKTGTMDVIFEKQTLPDNEKNLACNTKSIIDNHITRKFVTRKSPGQHTKDKFHLNLKNFKRDQYNKKGSLELDKNIINEIKSASCDILELLEWDSRTRSRSQENRNKFNIERMINQINDRAKNIRVLICDDESRSAVATSNVIKRCIKDNNEKYLIIPEIHIVDNGIECLYKLYQLFKSRNYIDLLLIDENMPFLNGSAVVKIILNMIADKYMNNMYIYILTSMEKEGVKFIDTKIARGYLTKPLKKKYVANILETDFRKFCLFP